MGKRRLASSLLAVAVAAGLALAPAALADGPRINEAGGPAFPERAYTLHVPREVSLGPDDVTVRENGDEVEGLGVQSAGAAAEGEFGTVLVIDASRSMAGSPIEEAMRAARAFSDRRSPGQELAVVTFNRKVDVALPLTTDADQISEVLSSEPKLGPSTHVQDAVAAAVRMLGQAGVTAGSVVLLSDGADTGSAASLADVTALARGAGVRVFAVGLRSKDFNPRALRRLAIDGAFANTARPRELAPIFERFGDILASDYLLRYHSAGEPGEALTVEVQVAGVPGVAQDRYVIPTPPADKAKPAQEGGFWKATGTMLAAIAIAAALFGVSLFVLARPQREAVRDRLARFVPVRGISDDPRAGSDGEAPRGPRAAAEGFLDGQRWWERFKEELDVARIQTPAIHIVAATALATFVVMLAIALGIGSVTLSPLGLLVIPAVRLVINRKLRHQRHEFAEQLADNLQIVASALRAGQSMVGAISVVIDEAPEPSRSEFRRIVNDERLGVPLEDAVRDVARRMDNRDLEQVALVAIIQRETGGNTAEVLDRVVDTVRERGTLRRLMETLTAQGRLSQIVVSVLPFALVAVITVVNADYMDPLFHTSTGQVLLLVGVGLSLLGSLLINRIVDVSD
ncbi:MAG TPA: type II secretion system F family protein [Solirubrobacterales bacterium]|nr:type II secretion system F family protein [Solirubrobacterales bacterium]